MLKLLLRWNSQILLSCLFTHKKLLNYNSYGSSFCAVIHYYKLYDCSEFACLQLLYTGLFWMEQHYAERNFLFFFLIFLQLLFFLSFVTSWAAHSFSLFLRGFYLFYKHTHKCFFWGYFFFPFLEFCCQKNNFASVLQDEHSYLSIFPIFKQASQSDSECSTGEMEGVKLPSAWSQAG